MTVKKIFNFKENYFYYFLFIYLFICIYFSLKVGITHDEAHSSWVWELNRDKIENLFFNTKNNVDILDTYHGYYGIGFYLISAPLDLFFSKLIDFKDVNTEGAHLLIKHPLVIIFFVTAGIYFKKIIFFTTKDKFFSNISSIFFLTYPYLLGHSFFNVKDVPFMSVWLISTYYIIKILSNYFIKNRAKKKDLIIFALLTSFLISLRISGFLIFVEYIIFLIFYINVFQLNFFSFIKKINKEIFVFSSIFLISLFLFYPNFWQDPLKFFYSIDFMRSHIQTVCTITLGECMKAQNLPSSYIFIWLFFKLPLIIIFGLLIFPFIEKKLFSKQQNILILGSLITSIFLITFLLILLNVNLYDELRQVLFLVPLIMIISLILIFNYKKKLGTGIISLFILFFIYQNIKMFPYNYIWINNSNFFLNVTKNFELDYWGVSTRNIGNFFNKKKHIQDACIISNRNKDGIKFFVINQATCFKPFSDLHKKNIRPFYVALTERAINKGVPNKCEIVHQEKVQMNFSKENLILAKVFKCD